MICSDTRVRQLIAAIDSIVKAQVISILEHNDFRNLLKNWSSLYYLINNTRHNSTRVKILNLKWHEVSGILSEGNMMDNILAYKILDELELPGNDPLSMLIGAYNLDVSDKATINALAYIAMICAHCFVPFISSVTVDIFDIDEVSQLTKINLEEFYKNNKFRYLVELAEDVNSNFIGLVIPDVFLPSLMSYTNKVYCSILGENIAKYANILGSGAFAFAAVVMNSFVSTGWFLDIAGIPPKDLALEEINNFGIVPSIKAQSFFDGHFESSNIFLKCSTEFFISERKERELADLGFIPICHVKGGETPVFYSNGSLKNLVFKVKQQDLFDASTSLQNILCICRFAHYIKIIGRQKLGLFSNVSEFQNYLNNWLQQYVSSDPETPLYLKHKYPLLQAKIEVFEDHFLKNNFKCKIYLKPHLISAQVLANITLTTTLSSLS